MNRLWPLASAGSRLAILLMVTVFLSGSAAPSRQPASRLAPPLATLTAAAGLAVPASFADPAVGLRDGPVPVPLELLLPSLDLAAPVVGVGVTAADVMDAPMGEADAPAWHQAFWYRGSAIPGAASTALFAGHVDDPLGRPAVFAHLDRLRPGDPVVVHDTRTGQDVGFLVTESRSYTLDQAGAPAVLTQIYGAGPVAGTTPEPSADGLSHLTLITCAGTFRNGTHDHRLVVYATRTT